MTKNFKFLLTIAVIMFFLGILLINESTKTGKLRIIFCDVGQGDGSLIITPNGREIVIDGGPGKKMSECLSSKIPFWDRDVELMIATHSQKDHMEGQIGVFADFLVKNTVFNGVGNETNVFEEWKRSLDFEKTNVISPKMGEKLVVDGVMLTVLWPGESEVQSWKNNPPKDLNETSVVVKVTYGDFCALFTGDIPLEILENLVVDSCQVLKVAHHGSKTGTSEELLSVLKPKMAFIQSGKNNSYGHPHKQVLDLLSKYSVNVFRNDVMGTIRLITDGKQIEVR